MDSTVTKKSPHTTINISVNLFPNNGSHYNPLYFGIILIIITAAIISIFGFAKNKSEAILQ